MRMVKRVTISVPDDLHEKMEKWREQFNFPQLFQKTIAAAIKNKEDFQNRLKGDKLY